jgi:hypothetical protein
MSNSFHNFWNTVGHGMAYQGMWQHSQCPGLVNVDRLGNFHPFDFTSKSHLRRINLCEGYFTFFFQTYFRITLYYHFRLVIVINSKSEESKAFVHPNCLFVHKAELSGRCNSSERKRPYSRVLYTSLEIEGEIHETQII